jgi:hypothetical protein
MKHPYKRSKVEVFSKEIYENLHVRIMEFVDRLTGVKFSITDKVTLIYDEKTKLITPEEKARVESRLQKIVNNWRKRYFKDQIQA